MGCGEKLTNMIWQDYVYFNNPPLEQRDCTEVEFCKACVCRDYLPSDFSGGTSTILRFFPHTCLKKKWSYKSLFFIWLQCAIAYMSDDGNFLSVFLEFIQSTISGLFSYVANTFTDNSRQEINERLYRIELTLLDTSSVLSDIKNSIELHHMGFTRIARSPSPSCISLSSTDTCTLDP